MSKISESELPSIAKIYNDEGRKAAYEVISSYGNRYPDAVIKRMRNHPKFVYNKETDTFLYQDKSNSEDVFMSIEELCSPEPTKQNIRRFDNRSNNMEKLIQELLSDRLLELSKYMVLEASSRTMIIDMTSLKSAGYRVITQ